MRRYIIALIIILVSTPALCQEYTYFMGISMNNNRVPFVKTLTKLGYFLDGLDISEPNITTVMYRGKYLGLNSSVFIRDNTAKNKVEYISVSIDVKVNDTISSRRHYIKAYEFLSNKYDWIDMRFTKDIGEPFFAYPLKCLFDDRIMLAYIKDINEFNGNVKYYPTITFYPLPLGLARSKEECK
ncbi:hypothetical protein F0475_02140 [Prevotella sp. A2879]|uniref:Uncharacterized protein n=1 Tax=Prevotella vespertina TaxID=2608404 RepID=A0A7C9HD55_9BACT|nr:hypothetical protein [Prevotella vespertina]MUL27145.1 hypothetical protein [Prevotella vespertina]